MTDYENNLLKQAGLWDTIKYDWLGMDATADRDAAYKQQADWHNAKGNIYNNLQLVRKHNSGQMLSQDQQASYDKLMQENQGQSSQQLQSQLQNQYNQYMQGGAKYKQMYGDRTADASGKGTQDANSAYSRLKNLHRYANKQISDNVNKLDMQSKVLSRVSAFGQGVADSVGAGDFVRGAQRLTNRLFGVDPNSTQRFYRQAGMSDKQRQMLGWAGQGLGYGLQLATMNPAAIARAAGGRGLMQGTLQSAKLWGKQLGNVVAHPIQSIKNIKNLRSSVQGIRNTVNAQNMRAAQQGAKQILKTTPPRPVGATPFKQTALQAKDMLMQGAKVTAKSLLRDTATDAAFSYASGQVQDETLKDVLQMARGGMGFRNRMRSNIDAMRTAAPLLRTTDAAGKSVNAMTHIANGGLNKAPQSLKNTAGSAFSTFGQAMQYNAPLVMHAFNTIPKDYAQSSDYVTQGYRNFNNAMKDVNFKDDAQYSGQVQRSKQLQQQLAKAHQKGDWSAITRLQKQLNTTQSGIQKRKKQLVDQIRTDAFDTAAQSTTQNGVKQYMRRNNVLYNLNTAKQKAFSAVPMIAGFPIMRMTGAVAKGLHLPFANTAFGGMAYQMGLGGFAQKPLTYAVGKLQDKYDTGDMDKYNPQKLAEDPESKWHDAAKKIMAGDTSSPQAQQLLQLHNKQVSDTMQRVTSKDFGLKYLQDPNHRAAVDRLMATKLRSWLQGDTGPGGSMQMGKNFKQFVRDRTKQIANDKDRMSRFMNAASDNGRYFSTQALPYVYQNIQNMPGGGADIVSKNFMTGARNFAITQFGRSVQQDILNGNWQNILQAMPTIMQACMNGMQT